MQLAQAPHPWACPHCRVCSGCWSPETRLRQLRLTQALTLCMQAVRPSVACADDATHSALPRRACKAVGHDDALHVLGHGAGELFFNKVGPVAQRILATSTSYSSLPLLQSLRLLCCFRPTAAPYKTNSNRNCCCCCNTEQAQKADATWSTVSTDFYTPPVISDAMSGCEAVAYRCLRKLGWFSAGTREGGGRSILRSMLSSQQVLRPSFLIE